MRRPEPTKTDLIIGMTLAETFLLILFVVWYSQGAGAGPSWEKIAKAREAQINDLKAQLQQQQDKVLELEKIRDWWRKNFGTNPPLSMDELQVALGPKGLTIIKTDQQAATKGAGRSNLTPKCSEKGLKDVLFTTVIRGRDLYGINGPDKKFDELLTAYEPELREARTRDCKYSVDVSYQSDVRTDDFVFALRRLRTVFYVQLLP
jgi:hypothetical protein